MSQSNLLGVTLLRVSLGVMWIAHALVPIMAVATSVHLGNGWVHTSANGGWEYPVFLIFASIALWLIGDGAFSVRRSERFVPSFKGA
jgi:putative oxidoreductase